MKDVNSSITQVYYELINNLSIPVHEGEEPDNVKEKLYCVISDISSRETSTKNTSDLSYTVQIRINSWEYKYNNSKSVNETADLILQEIKPFPNSVLDISSFGLQMLNLTLQSDITDRFGELAGRVYISRILTFKQDIFVI
jgi:hypothetical protein